MQNEIGARINLLRKALGLNAPKFGELLGCKGVTVLALEHGYTKFPKVKYIKRLRDLEVIHAEHIRLYNAGVRPEFYMSQRPERPCDIKEVDTVEEQAPRYTTRRIRRINSTHARATHYRHTTAKKNGHHNEANSPEQSG